MSVYVDAPAEYAAEPPGYVGHHRATKRWGHMIADTEEELHEMAHRVGLRRDWFQGDHYDLVPTRRAMAIRFGAVALKRRQFVEALRRVRAEWAGR